MMGRCRSSIRSLQGPPPVWETGEQEVDAAPVWVVFLVVWSSGAEEVESPLGGHPEGQQQVVLASAVSQAE